VVERSVQRKDQSRSIECCEACRDNGRRKAKISVAYSFLEVFVESEAQLTPDKIKVNSRRRVESHPTASIPRISPVLQMRNFRITTRLRTKGTT
jgi:hypothetical protein